MRTVNRSLAFIAAFALAAVQPAVTLGAHPSGSAPSRPPAPAPRLGDRGGPVNQGGNLKVPFHVDVQPLVPQHFTTRSPGFNPQAMVLPYQRYRWQTLPAYLWYPATSGPACYAANNFLNTPSDQLPPDLTIGSLVDGKSNLLSPLSYSAGYASANDASAASSNPFALQVGFYPSSCGTPSFTNF